MCSTKQISVWRNIMHQRSGRHWREYYYWNISSFERPLFTPSVDFAEGWACFNWNWCFLQWYAQGILNCYCEEKIRSQRKAHKKKQYSREDHRHIQGSR